MNYFLLLLSLCCGLASAPFARAQSKAPSSQTAARPAGAVAAGTHDQFLMQNGMVVLRQGAQIKQLTQNIRLSNGTKVNYKSGIVEFPTGKITTLQEGDYVTMQGDIVFATPASAATARGDKSVPTTKFTQYVERGTLTPSSIDGGTQVTTLTNKVGLMEKKIQLLNEKIRLLSAGTQPPADTKQLDQQLQTLDEQLKQL
ncbi:DUF6799 domain-containing protein [Hymenobacter cavernae]|nr:DUF6799 domain-containing protein [Hymenobacter cavernae]